MGLEVQHKLDKRSTVETHGISDEAITTLQKMLVSSTKFLSLGTTPTHREVRKGAGRAGMVMADEGNVDDTGQRLTFSTQVSKHGEPGRIKQG